MKLYHTSDREIRMPDLSIGRRNADFGHGFYLTPDKNFAGSWARERTASDIVVNEYKIHSEGLKIRIFEKSEEWLSYILSNRRGSADSLADYDVIIGPIASDTLFETYGIITSGLLSSEQALELLDIGPDYTQVAIKTQSALDNLRWAGSYTLDDDAIRIAGIHYEEERMKFDSEFAAALDSMDTAQ